MLDINDKEKEVFNNLLICVHYLIWSYIQILNPFFFRNKRLLRYYTKINLPSRNNAQFSVIIKKIFVDIVNVYVSANNKFYLNKGCPS